MGGMDDDVGLLVHNQPLIQHPDQQPLLGTIFSSLTGFNLEFSEHQKAFRISN